MILFFPQYQAGIVPSNIPTGTLSLRNIWKYSPDYAEVPLQSTNPLDPQTENGIRFREILTKQTIRARQIIENGNPDFILTTGGDCAASFASIDYINGKYNGKVGIIWIDAHADMHTPETSPSKNYHGMVMRNLIGEGEFDLQPKNPLKADEQIAYLGLRDIEDEEKDIIEYFKIPHYNAKALMADDFPVDAVVDYFQKRGITHLYLHVDCDVMDEKEFPYVHVPEPNGLTPDRLIQVLQRLRSRLPLAGCCLTEYAPKKAGDGLETLKRIYVEGFGLQLPT